MRWITLKNKKQKTEFQKALLIKNISRTFFKGQTYC